MTHYGPEPLPDRDPTPPDAYEDDDPADSELYLEDEDAMEEFDANTWAERFKANELAAAANDKMDSGWSKTEADRCQDQQRLLLFQLFDQLRNVELKPEDYFDRPALARVLAAVHTASR